MRKIIGNLDARGNSDEDVAEILEKAYINQKRGDQFKTKTTFSPSTVGYGHGNCPRFWYLAFEGNEWEDKTDLLGIANMAYGTSAHERIQGMLRESGSLAAEEVEVKMDDPPVRGFVDIMIKSGDEEIPGEIKTTRQEAYEYRQLSMKPAPYHLIQLLIYLKALKKERGFLLYENKNTQELLVIKVKLNEKNQEFLDYVLEWMRDVRKAFDDKTKPKPAFQARNKICQGCPLQKACRENEDFEVVLPKLEVKIK